MTNLFTTGSSRTGRTAFELLGQSYRPTALEVLQAGFQAGFEGPGSAAQDVAAVDIATETGQEVGLFQRGSAILNSALFGILSEDTQEEPAQAVTEEEWKASPYFRENLKYQEGMTTRAAEIIANRYDRQQDRDFVLSQSEGVLQSGIGLVGGFAGAMADAKNVAISAAVAAATPLVVGGVTAPAAPLAAGGAAVTVGGLRTLAKFGTTLTRLNSAGIQALKASRTARLSAVLGESVVSTLPQVVTGLQNVELTQEQYTVQDATLDLLASAGLSVGAHKAGEAISAAWRRYSTPDAMTEVAHVALQQIKAGERIDVQPLVASKISDFTPARLSVPEPAVRKMEDGRWEATIGTEAFIGRTQTEAVASAREAALSDSLTAVREAGYSPEAVAQIEEVLRVKMQRMPEQVEADLLDATPAVRQAREELRVAEQALAGASKNKVKVAERLVNSARERVAAAEAAARPQVQQVLTQNRLTFERQVAEADDRIRDIQRREAARMMPDYAKRQLDNSVEGQAARSIDPKALELVEEGVPPVKFDPDAPPPTPEDARLQAMRADPMFAKALEEAEGLDAAPQAAIRYAKCKAGR